MTEEKKDFKRTGGVESSLQGLGIFFLIASVVSLVLFLIASQEEIIQKAGLTLLLIGFGIAVLIQGLMFKTLFDAGAEVIRLLKRLNGLPYGGTISKTDGDGETFVCSDCGEPVAKRDKFCPQCGANL